MIPNNPDRGVRASAPESSTSFGISHEDEAHIMGLLRDAIYSDRVLAVLREYSSNAWDAHRAVGKGDVPIEVTLPTYNNFTLVIRDHGPGLSHDDVFAVYTQYGKSTKRGDDLAVGMLGIGSKSGFAYSDSFTVTSLHGGQKRVYVAVLDETDKGRISLVHEEPCGDETGIEIRIAVRQEDVNEFGIKAKKLFRHFEPRPVINIELPVIEGEVKLPSGSITPKPDYYTNAVWTAVMGCVPYQINVAQLPADDLGPLIKTMAATGGVVRCDIGALQIAASREDLRYSKATKKVLVDKITALVDEYIDLLLVDIENDDVTSWERRGKLQVLKSLELPVPELWAELLQEHVKIESELFSLRRRWEGDDRTGSIHFVSTERDTKFLIDDTGLPLSGYQLGRHWYVVRAYDQTKTPDEVRAMLNDALKKIQLDGAPVELLSSLYWEEYVDPKKKKQKGRKANKKHRALSFKLIPRYEYKHPYSSAWEPEVLREPTADDVYVIIDGFRSVDDFSDPTSSNKFFKRYAEDAKLADRFGVTMPPVYGYKTTKKKPLDRTKVVGIHYDEWRKERFTALLSTAENLRLIELLHWVAGPVDGTYRYYSVNHGWLHISSSTMTKVVDALGRSHPMTRFLAEIRRAARVTKSSRDLDNHRLAEVGNLALRLGLPFETSTAAKARDEVCKTYPLLAIIGLNRMDNNNVRALCDYIKLVDGAAAVSSRPTAKLISIAP